MELIKQDELRRRISEITARAHKGETFIVIRHGQPQCSIGPVQGGWTITDAKGDQ